jgi:hypothetical protein
VAMAPVSAAVQVTIRKSALGSAATLFVEGAGTVIFRSTLVVALQVLHWTSAMEVTSTKLAGDGTGRFEHKVEKVARGF